MSRMLLRMLDEAEVEKMHQKTLEVLQETGVKITHDEALARLSRAGARVDGATGVVRFPAEMVGELLKLAPSMSRHACLNGSVLEVGGENRYYASLVLDPFVVDHHDGLRRPKLEDVRRHTIIGESLDRVSAMMRMQFPVSDVPEPDCYYKTMEVFLCHTAKHVTAYPTSVENCRDWIEITAVIA